MVQSSKIGLAGIYYQTKLTFSKISKQKTRNELTYHILYFLMECCSRRLLNETEIAIQKYNPGRNHQDVIHRLLTVKTEDSSTNQIIRTKQSLLSSSRHYIESPL